MIYISFFGYLDAMKFKNGRNWKLNQRNAVMPD